MKTDKFKAELVVPPVKIERMFFAVSSFIFHPANLSDDKEKLMNIQISFDSDIVRIDKEHKTVEVQVTIQSVQEQDKKIEFAVMCVGVYTWLGEAFDEKAVKSIYQWGASVQTSSIREHIITQISRGPYNVPSPIPIGLIHIKTETPPEN